MKTSFKRFAALALAAIMVLGTMNMAAFADETNTAVGTGTRTKDSALVISGLKDGDIVRFYKVLEETQDVWGDNDTGWIYTSKFIGMSQGTYNTPVSTLVGNPAKNIPMSITADRAGYMARIIRDENALPRYTATAADGKVTVATPESGLYIAIITSVDPDTVYNPVFVSADYVQANQDPASSEWEIKKSVATYADSAAAKKSTLTIEKSASKAEDTWDDGSQYTTAIGDSVSFTVDTTIPGFGKVYQSPKFEITDSMTNLALQTDSIEVWEVVNGAETTKLTVGTEYRFDPAPTVDGYTIKFNYDYLRDNEIPVDIRVKYTAKVTTEALDNLTVEENKVKIKYSTNPTKNDDGQTIPDSPGDFSEKKDKTNHYTFSIDASSLFGNMSQHGTKGSELVKVGVGANGQPITEIHTSSELFPAKYQEGPLQGATFRLYTAEACNPADEYVPHNSNGDELPKVLYTSGADGRFTITGLDAGTYYLKEETAPAGFIKEQNPVKIQITADITQQKITEWFFNGTWYPTKEAAEAKAQEYWDDAANAAFKTAHPELNNDVAKFKEAYIKDWEYSVDVLNSYSIKIGEQAATTHTFIHKSYNTDIEWSESESVEIPASIVNHQGVELPSTGGIGTTIFYAGGAMLVLLAGVLLVSKRRIA